MRYIAIVVALLLSHIVHSPTVAGQEAATPAASEVIFGRFSCQAGVDGSVAGRLSVHLSFQGSLFASPESPVLSSTMYPEDAVRACAEVVSELHKTAEGLGCSAARAAFESTQNSKYSGMIMVCAGSRARVVEATEALGRRLLTFLSSLE